MNDSELNVGFYSCIYRRNDSAYASNEKLAVSLTGLHFVGEVDDDFKEIPSGGEDIILMRCNEAFGGTSYGMQCGWKSRGMSEAEIVNKTRQKESK